MNLFYYYIHKAIRIKRTSHSFFYMNKKDTSELYHNTNINKEHYNNNQKLNFVINHTGLIHIKEKRCSVAKHHFEQGEAR